MSNKNVLIINGQRFVECPYCHQAYKSLVRHIPTIHKITMEEFHKNFPDYCVQIGDSQFKEDSLRELKKSFSSYYKKFLKDDGLYHCPECNKGLKRISGLQEHCLSHGINLPSHKDFYGDQIQNEDYKCPYCDLLFKNYRGLQVHLSMKHKEEYINLKKEKERKEGFECPICGKIVAGIADHVRYTHHVEWEDFCEQYNWIYGGLYFSESHRKNLSLNKKYFYNNTPRGKELRQTQFKNLPHTTSPNCRSYFFSSDNDPYRYCRSFQEYAIIYILNKNHIEYKYEAFSVKYMKGGIQHVYIPDIIIGNKLFEIKSSENDFIEDEEKYMAVNNILEKTPYSLTLLTLKNYAEVLNVKKVPLLEIYSDIRKRFFEDKSFFIHGKFIYDQRYNRESPLLKTIFEETYKIFKKENLERINNTL